MVDLQYDAGSRREILVLCQDVAVIILMQQSQVGRDFRGPEGRAALSRSSLRSNWLGEWFLVVVTQASMHPAER